LIGMYIVIMRPIRFLQLVDNLYSDLKAPGFIASNNTRIRAFLCLLILFIIDMAPVPVTPAIAFVIILSRPQWFLGLVGNVYSDNV